MFPKRITLNFYLEIDIENFIQKEKNFRRGPSMIVQSANFSELKSGSPLPLTVLLSCDAISACHTSFQDTVSWAPPLCMGNCVSNLQMDVSHSSPSSANQDSETYQIFRVLCHYTHYFYFLYYFTFHNKLSQSLVTW